MSYTFDQPRIEQLQHRWESMQITRLAHEQAYEAAMIIAHKFVYEDIQRATNVPWFVIGVIDSREGGVQSLCTRHLHNGDSLHWLTRQVPAGRPHVGHGPPFTFRESAIDALHLEGIADKPTDWWCIERILHILEPYNGLGYWQIANPHRASTGGHPSPYIWSCTTIYDPPHGPGGKYDRDHHYNPSLLDPQVGCAPLLHAIAAADPSVKLWSIGDTTPVAAAAPVAAASPVGKISVSGEYVLPAPKKCYGMHPYRQGSIKWLFGELFHKRKLLEVTPPHFMHVRNDTQVPWYGNNHYGNCVWATKAHLIELRSRAAGNTVPPFTADSVLKNYSLATGFNPADPSSDRGTDMQQAAEYWRTQGFVDADGVAHKSEAYVLLGLRDWDELRLATYWFGGCELGVNVPISCEEQFDQHVPWTVVKDSPLQGGHCVALVGVNTKGDWVVETWNGLQAITPAWLDAYMDCAVGVFSLEYLDARGLSPERYDHTALTQKIGSLG